VALFFATVFLLTFLLERLAALADFLVTAFFVFFLVAIQKV
jgi:hypothetical protein